MNSTHWYLVNILFISAGFLINHLFYRWLKDFTLSNTVLWLGFFWILMSWILGYPFLAKQPVSGFMASELTWVIASLVLFISATLHSFSKRYMAGDSKYRRYFLCLTTLTVTTLCLVAADHLLLILVFWISSNFLLILLMVHKKSWQAAKQAGFLVFKTLSLGFVFLVVGFGIFWYQTQTPSLFYLTEHKTSLLGPLPLVGLGCICIGACVQSGVWPFHRWLLSSLNSPTPVSSFMHAGLISGGGILLARFSPLFFEYPFFLNGIFVVGAISATLGTLWKLVQTDVKRMLACSTMGQMGFMLMQCGMGLFPAAIAHVCWHGLFKACLFLRVGASIEEQRRLRSIKVGIPLMVAGGVGLLGACGFAWMSHKPLGVLNTNFLLIVFAWVAATQCAYTLLKSSNSSIDLVKNALGVGGLCFVLGMLYGWSVWIIEHALDPLSISFPQKINGLHVAVLVLMGSLWILVTIRESLAWETTPFLKRIYVGLFNASQPHPKTVTSIRQDYHY